MLSGEASQTEIEAVKAWAAQSPENDAFVKDAINLLNKVEDQTSSYQPNVELAWEKLNTRITQPAKVIELSRSQIMWRAAAAILLLVGLVITIRWAFSVTGVATESVLAQSSTITKTLSDGSTVKVEKGSEILFLNNEKGERRVSLKGAAEFEVVHDEAHPFIVETEGLLIEDIGTRFKVTAIPGNEAVTVEVQQGEVRFYLPGEAGVLLLAGESARYNKNSKQFEKLKSTNTLEPSETTARTLEFNESTLQEVVTRVNAMYNSHVVLANTNMKGCKLSVVFTDESLETILEVIAETLELEIEYKKDEIVLSGKGCAD